MDSHDKKKFINIRITDIQLHVAKPRNPNPMSRAIFKAVKNERPGRYYSNDLSVKKDGSFSLTMFLHREMQKIKEKYAKEGKEVRFILPEGGIWVYAGKDTVGHIEAHKKRALDRARG